MMTFRTLWRACISFARPRRLANDRNTLRAYTHSKQMSQDDQDHEELYRYSSGRWLWDEQARLLERYKHFDVQTLKHIAAKAVGARTCATITKLAEGGFNKVFRLVMDDGAVVIARIPMPIGGPPFLTVASEVATMDFVSTVLGIPVPKVLSWSAESENPVKSQYILMQEAAGTQLSKVWNDMELEEKFGIVEEVVAVEKKVMSVFFSRYGNIYFADGSVGGCNEAELSGDFDDATQINVRRRFRIGPVCDKPFWDGQRASMDVDRGPWLTPEAYLKAIAIREINWLSKHATPKDDNGFSSSSEAQRSPQAHIELYEKFEKVVDDLVPDEKDLARSALWHWDLHASNIFVQDGKITALIDWQDAWAGPLFLQARQPGLVRYDGETMLRLPESYEETEDEEERAAMRDKVEKSTVQWVYEADTKEANPLLHRVYILWQGKTRQETVGFATNTWDGDILPFRQCLIRIVRNWKEINTSGKPCPISFTDEELSAHARDGEGWNDSAKFWDSINHFVTRDGWAAHEDYDEALEFFAALREEGLKSLKGEELAAFERQTRWAVRP